MTVSSETARVSYVGSGTTGPLAIPFYFLANADLKVIRQTIADGVETTLVLTTDYTLTGAGVAAGGSLTLAAALSSSYRLIIIRDPAVTQGTDYGEGDVFPAETHETAIDRLTMICQRLVDKFRRAIKAPDGESGDIALSAVNWAARANKYFAFDSSGNPTTIAGTSETVTALRRFDSIALMKAATPAADGEVVFVTNYYEDIAGGGGHIEWLAGSTATIDNGTIIAADAGGTGRWHALGMHLFVDLARFGAKGDGTTVDTTAFTNAAATGKPVRGPYGTYVVDAPVTFNSNLHLEGGDTGQSLIKLTGTGQLLTGDSDVRFTGGFRIQTTVNNKTMVKVAHSRWYGDFSLDGESGATGLTGIEFVTGTGLYHCAFLPAEVRDIAVPIRITGANSFNNNQIGADYSWWYGATDFIRNESTLIFGVNKIKGYFEGGTNLFTAPAGSSPVRDNIFDVWLDAVTQAVNTAVTIAHNHWPQTPPEAFVTSGAGVVGAQSFVEKIKVRAFLNTTDQTIADNTDVKIAWNAETFDPDSAMTLSPNHRFEALRAMKVLVISQADISGNLANADRVNLHIYKNGAVHSSAKEYVAGGTNGARPRVMDILDLAEGDYLEIFAFANEAAGANSHTVSAGTAVTYFSVTEL